MRVSSTTTSPWSFLMTIFAIWCVYAYLYFQTPATQALTRYNLTIEQLNLLRVTIIIPLLAIWLIIGYAAKKVWRYGKTIKKGEDGKGFRLIARGFLMFLTALITSSFISLLIQMNPGDLEIRKNLTILNRFITIAINLLAYFYICRGSLKFLHLTKTEKIAEKSNWLIYVITVLISALFGFLVFNNPVREMSSDPNIAATFYLPDPLILLTIILPTGVTWYWALSAIRNLIVFRQNVEGVIYKSIIRHFYIGFLLVVLLTIFLQLLAQFTIFLVGANLSTILILVYIILLVETVGFILIASGSHKLQKLEII